MKKIVTLILAAVLVSNFSMANINSGNKISRIVTKPALEVSLQAVTSNDREGLTLTVLNIEDKEVEVTLRDFKGNVIFNEFKRNVDEYGKKFIMDQLEKGTYTFEISTKNSYISKKVILE
jgi:hypothetical protein